MGSIYKYYFENREIVMAMGNTTIDFGAFPGTSDTSRTITGQTNILAGTSLEAFLRATSSTDHSADEHRFENMKITVADIVAGTGFTIYAESLLSTCYGVWNVDWVWATP